MACDRTQRADALSLVVGTPLAKRMQVTNNSLILVERLPDTKWPQGMPMQKQRVFHTKTPGGPVMSWGRTGVLQSATNVAGPYENVSSAMSPYVIEDFSGTQRFFRVIE